MRKTEWPKGSGFHTISQRQKEKLLPFKQKYNNNNNASEIKPNYVQFVRRRGHCPKKYAIEMFLYLLVLSDDIH